MASHKNTRQRGKLSLSRYFQEFKVGDHVAVVQELSVLFGYNHRLQGRTGVILEKRGSAYFVEINDLNKPKRYVLKPIHLKKIEVAQ